MKILTLFLALILALMPERVPFVNDSQVQDLCVEEVCDVEEEAVLRSPLRTPKRLQISFEEPFVAFRPVHVRAFCLPSIPLCSARQWLKACMLRL